MGAGAAVERLCALRDGDRGHLRSDVSCLVALTRLHKLEARGHQDRSSLLDTVVHMPRCTDICKELVRCCHWSHGGDWRRYTCMYACEREHEICAHASIP